MRKERVLLLGGNYWPEPTGIGKYNGEMIDWLSAQGYECGVITTYPYYPFWKVQAPYVNNSSWFKQDEKKSGDGAPIKVWRCPHYVPAIPCGKKRIFSDVSFFITAFLQVFILLFRKRYDYVIAVAPCFQVGLLGILYRKIKGVKFIYHIQDLQIDAACELGMIKSKLLRRSMFWLEKLILRHSDHVSSISGGMIKKIKAKYERPVILFPNWADTEVFRPIQPTVDFRSRFHLSAEDKVVLYSGAIGEKQGLQSLLDTARELSYREDIKFVICGAGPYKEKLVLLAEKMRLVNVIFMSLQPVEIFNEFMNMADLHLVLQKAHANDLVMPSKITSILAVGGLALVTAEPQTSLYEAIAANNMGILIEPENQSALTNSILEAIDEPHCEIKRNAREYAKENLGIDKIISSFLSQVAEAKIKEPVIRGQNKPIQIDASMH